MFNNIKQMSVQLSTFPLVYNDANQDGDVSNATDESTDKSLDKDDVKSSTQTHHKKSSPPIWAFCALGMMTLLFLI